MCIMMYKDIYYSTVKVKEEIHIDSYIAIKMINDDNKLHPDLEQYYEMKKYTLQQCVCYPFIFFKGKESIFFTFKENKGKPNNYQEPPITMCVSSICTDKTLKTLCTKETEHSIGITF